MQLIDKILTGKIRISIIYLTGRYILKNLAILTLSPIESESESESFIDKLRHTVLAI